MCSAYDNVAGNHLKTQCPFVWPIIISESEASPIQVTTHLDVSRFIYLDTPCNVQCAVHTIFNMDWMGISTSTKSIQYSPYPLMVNPCHVSVHAMQWGGWILQGIYPNVPNHLNKHACTAFRPTFLNLSSSKWKRKTSEPLSSCSKEKQHLESSNMTSTGQIQSNPFFVLSVSIIPRSSCVAGVQRHKLRRYGPDLGENVHLSFRLQRARHQVSCDHAVLGETLVCKHAPKIPRVLPLITVEADKRILKRLVVLDTTRHAGSVTKL